MKPLHLTIGCILISGTIPINAIALSVDTGGPVQTLSRCTQDGIDYAGQSCNNVPTATGMTVALQIETVGCENNICIPTTDTYPAGCKLVSYNDAFGTHNFNGCYCTKLSSLHTPGTTTTTTNGVQTTTTTNMCGESTTTYKCAAGYYKSGTITESSGCTQCPLWDTSHGASPGTVYTDSARTITARGTSSAGSTNGISDCYINSALTYYDETGTFTVSNNSCTAQ